jgi:hypothetical protein
MQTQPTDADVEAFLDAVESDRRREDAQRLCQIMAEETGAPPVMWGPAIVGFGTTEYTNTTGTHAFFRVGFSPRKANLAPYGLPDPDASFGPFSKSKSCLYVKDLRKVDEDVLRELIRSAA